MLWQGQHPIHRAAVSCGNHFFAHEVKANYSWGLPFIEVATYGITNLLAQAVKIVCLGKDRLTESARRVASFRSILYQEYQLVHTKSLGL